MDYYNKYIKYKQKYINKKIVGGSYLKLYHGSPFRLEEIEPHTPRGNNDFNTQTGVYMTDLEIEAKLYAMARDKDRVNKGWGIKDNNLILRKDLWIDGKYSLNCHGYLHIYETNEAVQNPYNKHEYRIDKKVIPQQIIRVKFDDIKNNIIYVNREEFNSIFDIK